MKKQLKNWLLLNNIKSFFIKKQKPLLCLLLFCSLKNSGQIANYIANGSFEDIYTCSGPYYNLKMAKSWLSIDSIKYDGAYISYCVGNIPFNGSTYQFPRTGNAYILSTFFFPTVNSGRGYFKNRLKQKLLAGKTYCVKFYINISNSSPRGMDGFGIYFGDNTIDTITKCNVPLSYLNPQVKNPIGNVISDTLNWVPVTGTFVATGNEKYALVGNFLSDASVNTSPIYTSYYPQNWTDVCVDDVSCIPLDLPAFAGTDTYALPNSTVYIGRPCDVGIDEACMWYHLPNTTTAIDTVAGITVTVAATTQTYMVKQDICGIIKYDTVVLYASGVGIKSLSGVEADNMKLYPNPAKNNVTLELNGLKPQTLKFTITDILGIIVREEDVEVKAVNEKINFDLSLTNGIYLVTITNTKNEKTTKKLVITK